MKKVKMSLTAVLVFAIVGSALAFKTFNPANIFCNDQLGHCTVSVNWTDQFTTGSTTTNPCGETTANKHYSTTQSSTTGCPIETKTVYVPNQQ